jgi:hypothetical protein
MINRANGMRMVRLAGLLVILPPATGCAFFEKRPPADPVWAAVIPAYGPLSLRQDRPPPPFPRASAAQRDATERARAFLTAKLPTSIGDFEQGLQRDGFLCIVYGGGLGTQCTYTKAHPPEPCFLSIRVSVEVNFPYPQGPNTVESRKSLISAKDIDVTAMVIEDREHHDDRGCMIL